jgi:hypothetical protein
LLIEKLFSAGIMKMGPAPVDPGRQVGVFNPAFISSLPALRASEMEKIHWLVGDWIHENVVPATREERGDDGSWAYIDEWRFSRKR